jgi:antitoxin ParD1/3/4
MFLAFWSKSMHVNLSPEMEQFLRRKVETGFYANASEVVRDAIRRMHEEDEKVAALQRALEEGDNQLDKGEGRPYTPDLLTRATAKARDNARRVKKVAPDVKP